MNAKRIKVSRVIHDVRAGEDMCVTLDVLQREAAGVDRRKHVRHVISDQQRSAFRRCWRRYVGMVGACRCMGTENNDSH